MSKQLPKRAGSRVQYVFWMIVAVTFACMGAVFEYGSQSAGPDSVLRRYRYGHA